MPPKSEHSKFSPSSAHRWLTCTASIELEAQIPDEAEKPAADWGTYCHYIAERTLLHQAKPEDFLGKKKYGQMCDQEMVDCANDYLGAVDNLMTDMDGYTERVEAKVTLDDWGLPEVYGTADHIIDEHFGTLTVVDLKAGSGVIVSPEDNPQAMIYALGAAGRGLSSYTDIRIIIIQPRGRQGDIVKEWTVNPSVLADWLEDTLRPAVASISGGNTVFSPSESNCKFCEAAGQCRALAEHNMKNAQEIFSPVAKDTLDVDSLSNDEVAAILPKLPLLSKWMRAVEARAAGELAKGHNVEGYKLVNGRKSRFWESEEEAIKFLESVGIDPYVKKVISPAQAEKNKEIKKDLKAFIGSRAGKPSMAPLSDKRPAIELLTEVFN